MEKHRVAVVCAEKDPITCHRMILICRALRREQLEQMGLFETEEDLVERAYDLQGQKFASAGKGSPLGGKVQERWEKGR